MADEREVLVEVKNLEVTYGSGRKAYKAVKNANFTIYKGETFGLVGESGSGKTTIGRAIMRILPTSGGQVLYKGQQINGKISHALDRQVIKEIQMIFQDPQSSLNERAKVSYIVGEGLMNVRPDLSAAERDEKVRQALLDVGLLPEFASRFPHEFSGGQRQRIGIARALIVEPEFIIADEPISALDMSIRAQVLNLLRHMQKERGTTGSPKGVMLTDDCFNGIALQFQAYPKLFHRGQKLMNVMPPFIAYGFACGIHLPLVLGFTVIIIPNLDPAKLGSLVLKYKPEHMFGVPTHYQQLAADPKLRDKDLSFIINYAAGGDSLSRGAEQTVNDFLAAHGARYPIAKGYGMTEVSSAATVAAGLDNKPGSVGIPMVNTIIAAFEPGTEKELPIGERGELCISGPTTMKGYYNKADETAMILRRHPDGRIWVHTGDMGYLDEDGFVFLDSRIKRMIIRHDGFKVFPSMIENVVSRHPAVHQCSVVGCTDKDHVQGRLPFVYIVLKSDTTAKKKQVIRELERMCAEELPEYVQPVAYKFISSMPMTPVGKVDYRQLEADISPRDY